MNISRLFILRPIATLLLSIALTVVGAVSFRFLPVAPIPTVDMPVRNCGQSNICLTGDRNIQQRIACRRVS